MKLSLEYYFNEEYNFNNSRLSNSQELINSKQYQQPHTHNTMKNIKLNTSRKSGFSLVEMLVVIAIIGIIAAIAIPNIGNLNASARDASARRNAQTVASVVNAAIAAGASTASIGTTADAVAAAQAGLTPTQGAFQSKTFTSGAINSEELTAVTNYLSWDNTNKQLNYLQTSN
jgi:prepilin-type N-terminal cleavage/methylation domain-containing protein